MQWIQYTDQNDKLAWIDMSKVRTLSFEDPITYINFDHEHVVIAKEKPEQLLAAIGVNHPAVRK